MAPLLRRTITSWMCFSILYINSKADCTIKLKATTQDDRIFIEWNKMYCARADYVRLYIKERQSLRESDDKRLTKGAVHTIVHPSGPYTHMRVLCSNPDCYSEIVEIPIKQATPPTSAIPPVTLSSTKVSTTQTSTTTKTTRRTTSTPLTKVTPMKFTQRPDTRTLMTTKQFTSTSSTRRSITAKISTTTKSPSNDEATTSFQNGSLTQSENNEESKGNNIYIYVGAGAGVGAFIIALIIVCVCLKMRKKQRNADHGDNDGVATDIPEYAVVNKPNKTKDSDAGDESALKSPPVQPEACAEAVPEACAGAVPGLPNRNYGQELSYVEVCFNANNEGGEGQNIVIHGVENKCEYAEVTVTPKNE